MNDRQLLHVNVDALTPLTHPIDLMDHQVFPLKLSPHRADVPPVSSDQSPRALRILFKDQDLRCRSRQRPVSLIQRCVIRSRGVIVVEGGKDGM